MIPRTLAIAWTVLRESLRGPASRVGAPLLFALAPVVTWLGGDDPASRAFALRTLTVESLRLLLPLAAVVGGAFVLRPALRRGYALLPARRGEWLAGTALGALALTAGAVAVLAAGVLAAAFALGPAAHQVVPQVASRVESTEGAIVDRAWARHGISEIRFHFDDAPAGPLEGTIDYELAWTAQHAPGRDLPFKLIVRGSAFTGEAEARAEGRRNASFSAPPAGPGPMTLVLEPTDPALFVGVRPSEFVLHHDSVSPVGSVVWLAWAALAGAALCLCFTLTVRAWSTAPTAALAGLLLLAALTLLPGMAPTGRMAAERRADVEGARQDGALIAKLGDQLASLPELLPARAFADFQRGRVVSPAPDAAWRAMAALALLPLGALLLHRRQIAK